MAIGYARTESVNRAVRANGKRGNAVASSAYAARAKMVDESTGAVYDFRRLAKGSPPILLPVVVPDGQPGIERQELWTKAEQAERQHNSTVARSMIGALPNELDADAQQRICKHVAEFMAKAHGVAVDAAIHRDAGNNHVHFLFTSRRYEDGELGKKTRELDVKGTSSKALRTIRKHWQDVCNAELEAAGFSERIDMRSYDDRGENKLGQIHLGSDAWHHQERTGENDKADRNEARKAGNQARAAEADAERFEAEADAYERQAEALRGQAKVIKAESEHAEIAEAFSSIFLSPDEEAELAKKPQAEPRREPQRASIFLSAEEEAALAPPAKPAPKNPVSHPIFIMPEETAAKELYSSLYRFMGGDIPADDLIADIGRFRSPNNLAMLNHVDANGNRFTHLSSAILGKLERDAGGQPGKLVHLRRLLKVFGEIEEAWTSSGGKLDRKAHNGSGQSPAVVRGDGLGNWPERQRAAELLRAIDGVSTGAISDEAFFAVAGSMKSPETAVCFDGVQVNGKGLDDLLRQLWGSPRGKANTHLMAAVNRAIKVAMETGRLERDFDKLAKLTAMTAPPAEPAQPTAAITPWAAPAPSWANTGTARATSHQPRWKVGTAVRVVYKPAKRQAAPGSRAKWQVGTLRKERISRNQVGYGLHRLHADNGVIQVPLYPIGQPAVGGPISSAELGQKLNQRSMSSGPTVDGEVIVSSSTSRAQQEADIQNNKLQRDNKAYWDKLLNRK